MDSIFQPTYAINIGRLAFNYISQQIWNFQFTFKFHSGKADYGDLWLKEINTIKIYPGC